MRKVRVLVVDDYEQYRQAVCRMLQPRLDWQVIGEASDGLEAVQKAQELQPDLVLLDIGLPTLNGFEVARRIRELSPNSKVLFNSLEPSAEIVQKALREGAVGYLLKKDAGGELLAAVDAVLQGRLYLSSGIDHHVLTTFLDEHIVERPRPEEAPAPRPSREHVFASYSDETSFVDVYVRFIESALEERKMVIVVVTELHQQMLLERLQEHKWDLSILLQQGRLRFLDVNDALPLFMVNDWPDRNLLLKVMDDLVEEATRVLPGEHLRIAAPGECAPTLWAQGKLEAAIELEHLWDQVARSHGIDILCAYPLSSRSSNENIEAWQRICAEHSEIQAS